MMVDDPAAKVEQEQTRLNEALGRLEAAVRGIGERASQEAMQLRAERVALNSQLTTMNTDHESLSDRLDNMQASYTELEQTIDQVTKRLDATIGQIKSVLD